MSFIEKIKLLIAKDELSSALQQLQTLLENTPLLNEAIHQAGRFQDIQKQIRLGVISHENATLTKNQIRAGLLDLISEIENQQHQKPKIKKEFEKAISIVSSKNVVVGNISAGGDISIGDTNINESKTSQRLKLFLYLLVPILAIGGAFFWYQYQQMQQPLQLKVLIKNKTPNVELPKPNGELTLIYGGKKEIKNNILTEVFFEGIPPSFKEKKVQLNYSAKGFEKIDTSIILNDATMNLPIYRNDDLAIIQGVISDEAGQGINGVKISTSCCKTDTDEVGTFKLDIPFHAQRTQQRLDISKEGYQSKSITTPVFKGEIVRINLSEK